MKIKLKRAEPEPEKKALMTRTWDLRNKQERAHESTRPDEYPTRPDPIPENHVNKYPT
ncbi:hypothetical protein Hanom_Chr04g00338791 [Helianthus anomalus]